MARQAPNPIDVQDFQFKLHCRLKVFANEDNSAFNKPCSLVATANRFGLIFVGTASPSFQVIQVNSIEKHTVKDGEITNYSRRTISLPSAPRHLTVNCDTTKLAVVVEKYGCPIGLIYDVASVMKQDCSVLSEIRLSPTPGVNVIETSWNPSIPNIFTACKSDGTLGLYELKETGIDINELPPESKSSCMCWSPKGKQIAVGSLDGKITQYKPELKAMKAVNAPALEGPHSVIAIQWISNYQFIALYKPQNTDGGASLLVVDSPKTGETVYTNYEDICYSYGNTRPMQFYLVHQAVWNILMVASANSMEVGVLGNQNEQWTQWILADAARAELPLSASKQETMPVGLAFNTSAVEPVLWGETSLPPAPFLLLLSHHGLLCCFRVINIKSGVSTICQEPERFADTSGLNQFKTTGSGVELKIPVVEPPKPVHLAAPIPELAAVPAPSSLPLSMPSFTTAPQLPQPPLFSTPPAQFAAPKPEPPPLFKPDPQQPPVSAPVAQQPPSVAKSLPQNLFGSLGQQQMTPPAAPPAVAASKAVPVVSAATSLPTQANETNVVQEEADLLIGKLVREECEALEAELKVLLLRGRSVKIDLGSDSEAVELVHGTDMLQDFLKEVTETSAVQGAEVHSLKQGLIQTWAWYEDARSRFAQTQDATLEALLRIQQLDPVSQRYLADIQHMTYYLESQLMQAGRSLDERWENFQDSCRKIVRLKIPTMEAIYQTMVRQSVIYQKQKYVLKDLSSRIRAHRSKINSPSLFVSLNDADQLEKELKRLQLEPQHLFQAQYERVVQNQQRLTANKVQKLGKLLLDREITRVTVNKPQLSNTLQSLMQSSAAAASQVQNQKTASDSSVLLGAALSPIFSGKPVAPRTVDFTQSTPKPAVHIEQKQNYGLGATSGMDILKDLPPGLSIKFTSSAPTLNTIPAVHEPSTSISSTVAKSETAAPAVTAPLSFKFSTIPSASVPTLSSSNNQPLSTQPSSTPQLNFLQFTSPPKASTTHAPVTITPVSQVPSSQGTPLNLSAAKPSMSFGSLFSATKPASTFNFTFISPSTASTTSAPNTKPLASTASSAFVPTTQQLGFNFSAKSTPNSTISSSALTKPAFVFGTAAPATSSTSAAKNVIASDASKIISGLVTTPSTTAVTVVANVTSSASGPVFGLFKTPSAVQPTTASITVPKVSEMVSQGVSAPKSPNIPLIPQSVAISLVPVSSTPASPLVSSTSNDKVVTTAAQSVSSSQGSFFGTATTVSSENIAVAKTTPSFTSPTTVSGTSIFSSGTTGTNTTLKPNESVSQPSIFAKAAETANSVFATTPKSPSIFAAPTTTTTTTTSEEVFGTTTGSIFAAPPPLLSATTATGSLFSQAAGTATTGSIFGSIATQQGPSQSVASSAPFTAAVSTPTGIFGSTAATITTTTASVFSPTTTTTSSAGFGVPSPTPGFGSAATLANPIFGATTTSAAIFPTPGFGTSTTSSIFGQPSTTTSSFATSTGSVFGGTPKTTGGAFGAPAAFPSNTNTFGGSGSFGNTTTASGSLFAQPGFAFGAPVSSSANTFGSVTAASPTFGSGSSVFGAPNSASSDFGQSQPSSSFSFAAAAANVPSTNSAFGFSKPSGFGFGSAPASTDSSSFSFGNLNMGAATTTNSFGSGFAQPSNSNPFAKVVAQEQKSAFGGGSLFGTPATTSATTSIFGGGGAPNSGFGNPAPFGSAPGFGSSSTFGQQSTFAAQNSFGNSFGSPSQPGPFSGGNQSVAQTGFGSFGQVQKPAGFSAAPVFGGSPGAFGSPPAFGSTSPAFGGAPSFGSPSKMFGNSPSPTGTFGVAPQQQNPTFANLATQNTLGFGALAQQSQPPSSSSSFSGGSSFSTWR